MCQQRMRASAIFRDKFMWCRRCSFKLYTLGKMFYDFFEASIFLYIPKIMWHKFQSSPLPAHWSIRAWEWQKRGKIMHWKVLMHLAKHLTILFPDALQILLHLDQQLRNIAAYLNHRTLRSGISIPQLDSKRKNSFIK